MTLLLSAWTFVKTPLGRIVIGAVLVIALIAYIRYDAKQSVIREIEVKATKQKEEARREREKIDSDTRNLSDDRILKCLRDPSGC